jgi:heme O synthase-like polyprenyltransferase
VSLSLYLTGDVGLIYLALAGGFGLAFVWMAGKQLRLASNRAAAALFHYSTTYLAIVFGAMVLDRLIAL